MTRLLVCGGRDFGDARVANMALDAFHRLRPVTVLIEGGQRGADRIARYWAVAHNIPVETFPADWDRYGNAAGPIRNGQMLREGKPDVVLAFPGRTGTADMRRQARAAGVEVRVVELPQRKIRTLPTALFDNAHIDPETGSDRRYD